MGCRGLPLSVAALALCLSCARGRAPDAGRGSTPPAAPSPSDCGAESGFDVLHHSVELNVEITPPSLSGEGDLRLRAVRETSVVVLDAKGLDVRAVSLNAAPLLFQAKDARLCALLPKHVEEGDEITLHVEWTSATDHDALHFSPTDVWAGYETSAWMPTLQDPAQRATLSLRILAPPELRVVASGRPVKASVERAADASSASASFAMHAVELERPTPPFLYAFAAGQFSEESLDAGGIRLRALGPAGVDMKPALRATAASLAFLQAHTGSPYPGAEYTQVFVSGDAAQEAAGLAILGAESLDDLRKGEKDDWVFTHELAHQWFGVSVPCADFADFWLNEGFATFFVAAAKEERWGAEAYAGELKNFRARSVKVHDAGKDAPVALSDPSGGAPRRVAESDLQPRGVTYFRGALVLDKLRRELGDVAFWNGIRLYTRERAGKRGTRTADLRAAFEVSSGRSLEAFFTTWVYRAAPGLSE